MQGGAEGEQGSDSSRRGLNGMKMGAEAGRGVVDQMFTGGGGTLSGMVEGWGRIERLERGKDGSIALHLEGGAGRHGGAWRRGLGRMLIGEVWIELSVVGEGDRDGWKGRRRDGVEEGLSPGGAWRWETASGRGVRMWTGQRQGGKERRGRDACACVR